VRPIAGQVNTAPKGLFPDVTTNTHSNDIARLRQVFKNQCHFILPERHRLAHAIYDFLILSSTGG